MDSNSSLGLSKGSVVEEYAARLQELEDMTSDYRAYLGQKTDEEIAIIKKEIEVAENRFYSRLKSEELIGRYKRCVSVRNEKLSGTSSILGLVLFTFTLPYVVIISNSLSPTRLHSPWGWVNRGTLPPCCWVISSQVP